MTIEALTNRPPFCLRVSTNPLIPSVVKDESPTFVSPEIHVIFGQWYVGSKWQVSKCTVG